MQFANTNWQSNITEKMHTHSFSFRIHGLFKVSLWSVISLNIISNELLIAEKEC